MHATFSQTQSPDSGRPIRGTFYPSDGPGGGGSLGSMLPKLIGILAAMAVIRSVVGGVKRHQGGSGWSRRREAIAELHRELHAGDTAAEPAKDVKA